MVGNGVFVGETAGVAVGVEVLTGVETFTIGATTGSSMGLKSSNGRDS